MFGTIFIIYFFKFTLFSLSLVLDHAYKHQRMKRKEKKRKEKKRKNSQTAFFIDSKILKLRVISRRTNYFNGITALHTHRNIL